METKLQYLARALERQRMYVKCLAQENVPTDPDAAARGRLEYDRAIAQLRSYEIDYSMAIHEDLKQNKGRVLCDQNLPNEPVQTGAGQCEGSETGSENKT